MQSRAQLLKYKGDRCAHCGLTVEDTLAKFGTVKGLFHFNHVDPSKKHPQYENIIRRVISTEQLDELDKCVLLCSFCHPLVHAQNINGELFVTLRVGKRFAEQRVKGQFIANNHGPTLTFLTDEQLLVIPYWVQLGARKPRLAIGTELHNGMLFDYMRQVTSRGTLTVRDWNGKDVLKLLKVAEGKYEMIHAVRFPLLVSELRQDGKTEMWLRNGVALTRDGKVITNGSVRYEFTTEYANQFGERLRSLLCTGPGREAERAVASGRG